MPLNTPMTKYRSTENIMIRAENETPHGGKSIER